MANATYDAHPQDDNPRGPAQYTNVVGAAISLAVFLGIAGWATKTMLRDASGVPTVRAIQGPMTVEPDTPGGVPASHLGLTVNQVSGSSQIDPSAAVRLAPRPEGLTAQDVPGALLTADRPVARPAAFVIDDFAATVDAAVVEATEVVPTANRVLPGVAMAHVRPQTRPAVFGSAAGQAPVVAEPAAAVLPVAAGIAQGTRLAQLGAYESQDLAEREWLRISRLHSNFFAGKTHVVQAAVKNGKTFYRLRVVGFAEAAETRRFCAALNAKNLACYSVVMQ